MRLDLENEPEPDAILYVEPSLGGRTEISPDDYLEGPPELVAEVSAGTLRRDLGLKLDLYREKGVLEYLVLRAGRCDADWFHLEGASYDAAALFRNDLRRLREVVLAGTSTPGHAAFVARLRARRR